MKDLNYLAKKMQQYARNVEPAVNEVKKKVANVVLRKVAENTLVDTGQAISSWQVGLDAPVAGIRDAYVSGDFGSTYFSNVEATVRRGTNIIATSRRADERIYINNNLNYINALDKGKSSQAPEGFVAISISEGLAALRNQRFSLTKIRTV